ncbi:MAG: NlpC/P60 family protein [Actinomycetota bacterium]|nr:NlpC/P60 family protein [Actinomycetota bacterium]
MGHSQWRRVVAAAFLASLALGIAQGPSVATPRFDDVEDARRRSDDVAAALVTARADLGSARGAAAAARARLSAIERSFELVVERYNLVAEKLLSLHTDRAATELAIRRLEQKIILNETNAATIANELYKGGTQDTLEALLSAESWADIERRLEIIESSEAARREVFAALAASRARLQGEVAELDRQTATIAEVRGRLSALAQEIDLKARAQREEIAGLNAIVAGAKRREALLVERRAAAERQRERAERRWEQYQAQQAALATPDPAAGLIGPGALTLDGTSGGGGFAAEAALSQLGKPYLWAADGPDTYDCSGLTMWAWAHAGVLLPHNSGAQYAATTRVAVADWKPGDLLFFGRPIHHVGIYIGGGEMVEAPYTGAFVRVATAIRSDYVGAGRP